MFGIALTVACAKSTFGNVFARMLLGPAALILLLTGISVLRSDFVITITQPLLGMLFSYKTADILAQSLISALFGIMAFAVAIMTAKILVGASKSLDPTLRAQSLSRLDW